MPCLELVHSYIHGIRLSRIDKFITTINNESRMPASCISQGIPGISTLATNHLPLLYDIASALLGLQSMHAPPISGALQPPLQSHRTAQLSLPQACPCPPVHMHQWLAGLSFTLAWNSCPRCLLFAAVYIQSCPFFFMFLDGVLAWTISLRQAPGTAAGTHSIRKTKNPTMVGFMMCRSTSP